MSGRGLTIRTQVVLAVAGVSLVTVVGVATLVMDRVQARAHDLAFTAARDDARLAATMASRGLARPGATFAGAVRIVRSARRLFATGEASESTRLQLIDAQRHLVFDSATDADATAGELRRQRSAEATSDVLDVLAGRIQSEPYLVGDEAVAASVAVEQDTRVVGLVRVIKPAIGMRAVLGDVAPEIATVAGLLFVAALGIALGLGRSIAAPILRLTEAARRIARGDRASTLPEPRGAEVRALTEAFDEMRRELEDRHRIERFTEDLSHELKNPVAAIRALAESLEDGGLSDPEAGPRLLGRIGEATARVQAIIDDLLALARLEARGLHREGRVSVPQLIRDAHEDVAARAARQDVRLKVGDVPAMELRGDGSWLRRAVANLLANGIENTQPGGTVRLDVRRSDGRVAISVRNDPGSVPSELRETLFERFVTRRPEGTGLGLAIVRSVAEEHGGTARLVRAGPPAVEIVMELPR